MLELKGVHRPIIANNIMDNQPIYTSNEDAKFKKYLTSEVKFVIGVLVFAFGAVKPYYEMKQDIRLIQNDISNINGNHIAHLQDLKQDIKDLQEEQNQLTKQMIDLQKQILYK